MVIDSNSLKLQNPWWEDPSAIKRDQHLLEIANKPYKYVPPIVENLSFERGDIHIIRGPRQVGKTTTIKLIIEKLISHLSRPTAVIYLSCESLESHKELQPVLIDLLKEKKDEHTYVFLDEISFVDSWQRAVLGLANMGLLRNTTLVLTGSNARDLKESSERLPGRRGKGRDHKIYPLSIPELARLECFKNERPENLLKIYMFVGGFPRAIADYITLGSVSDSTYETYRNWIVGDAQRYELRQETLKHILFRISETIASRVTWPILIENSPVRSHETALQYVEHLQDAFLCKIHYCYDNKMGGPAFQKARKLFFIDPLIYAVAATWKDGIANIYNWMTQKLEASDFRGKFFEAVVVNHADRAHDQTYYWYSTKLNKEVDLVIPSKQQKELYEIKLQPCRSFEAMGTKVKIIDPEEFLKQVNRGHET